MSEHLFLEGAAKHERCIFCQAAHVEPVNCIPKQDQYEVAQAMANHVGLILARGVTGVPAKLTINRFNNGQVRLAIQDERSGLEFLDAKMSVAAFGNAVMGVAYQPMKMEMVPDARIGLKREIKRHTVTIEGATSFNKESWPLIREAAREYEGEGWVADVGDRVLGNQHNWTNNSICIAFYRYV